MSKVQDLALGRVKLHPIGISPCLQPIQVPLQSSPAFQQVDTPSQFGVICKFANDGLNPLIQIFDKDVKQNWAQHRSLGNTTGDRPPAGCSPVHQHSLGLAIQPALNPADSAPVQVTGCQLFQQYAVGDSVKGFAEVQIDHIHSLPLIHLVGHLIVKGDQVGQTEPALPKSVLTGSEPLSILKVLCDHTQDDLLHSLSRHRGQADRPVVAQVSAEQSGTIKKYINKKSSPRCTRTKLTVV
ncbi:hypothetical protein WISP_149712 [Willisornis vidua]|uniref:Uncharacterized protein n=1 Tax=Willisornis vidua TaxID=1566151 RepID=A0ABQ9CJX1_9PASS|nr:hypothetical protein WISP_149712 [Willisornis vidua]